MLQGGAGEAEGSTGIAPHLEDAYTVVSYDRRGLSRSTLDDPTAPVTIATHSDDVHRLLAALTDTPALLFGSSIGALIALDLVTRHPDQVRTVVAHEAAAADLLPEPSRSQLRQFQSDVEATFRREGMGSAMQKLFAIAEVSFGDDREADAIMPAPRPERAANLQRFLAYDAPAAHQHVLDIVGLQAAAPRIVPAAGSTSRGAFPHRCAEALAALLGCALVEFPGGHSSYVFRPRAFAAQLRAVFEGA
jgi:pimeloyl-ACP methyl ester carboxylesterase